MRYGLWFQTKTLFNVANGSVQNDFLKKQTGDYSARIDVLGDSVVHFHPTVTQECCNASLKIALASKYPTEIKVSCNGCMAEAIVTDVFSEVEIAGITGAVTEITLEIKGASSVYVDDVVLDGKGLFKKTIETMKEELAQTKASRTCEAFRRYLDSGETEWLNRPFAKLWLNEDVEGANRELMEHIAQKSEYFFAKPSLESRRQQWCVMDSHLQYWSYYFCFGSCGTVEKGRLFPETEKALLEYLWNLMEPLNDIHFAKRSTWYLNSSENHDLSHKAACLFSSMVFRKLDDYKDRIYPDAGLGFSHEHTSPISEKGVKTMMGSYNSEDHYQAWIAFFHEYINERVKKGFFLERSACGYMKWTISDFLGIYNFIDDAGIRKKSKEFLDLIWADWATEVIAGVRGGVKTRHHHTAGEDGNASMTIMAEYLMGGMGEAKLSFKQMMLGDYVMPDIVLKMALDRRGMGSFTYLSRGIIEENPQVPRPAGCDDTLIMDVASRCTRVSYVTPDYILASQHEHPNAVYSHLACVGRWLGLTTSDPKARIVPVALRGDKQPVNQQAFYSMELVCNSVQWENVLIFQRKWHWHKVSPDMFPGGQDTPEDTGVFIGTGWEEIRVVENMLFLRKGNVYAGLRVIRCLTDEDPYAWAKGTGKYTYLEVMSDDAFVLEQNNTIIRLRNPLSPMILEVANADDYPDFDTFVAAACNHKPKLTSGVARRETELVISYHAMKENAPELLYNAANNHQMSKINGQYIQYEYPYVFDSPYMKSLYNSGQVAIQYDNDELNMNFTE